jgi:xRRM domain
MNSAQLMKLDVTSAIAKMKGKGKDKECSIEEISPFQVEATKFGLRVLSKAKWEGFRAEYSCYRQELVDEINTYQDEGQSEVYGGGRKRRYLDEIHDQEEEQITEEDSNQTQGVYIQSQSSNSAYPPGCLVFVRNVHSDTNKTTLRSLFLHARRSSVESRVESGKKDDGGLDYLDYTKGMDCVCVLFLSMLSCLLNS